MAGLELIGAASLGALIVLAIFVAATVTEDPPGVTPWERPTDAQRAAWYEVDETLGEHPGTTEQEIKRDQCRKS